MRKFTNYFLMCFAMVALVACDIKDLPTGGEPVGEPVITLSLAEVEATAEGGNYSVNYSVANSVESAMLTVVEDVEWITDVNVEADKISFTVVANSSKDERVATISVEYPAAEAKSFDVKQLGQADAFVIDVQEVHIMPFIDWN